MKGFFHQMLSLPSSSCRV